MTHFAHNLRRIMARLNLTVRQVARRTGLDDRTIKGVLSGANAKPHARTLHQLATGLGVGTDEFFQSPVMLARRRFDRQTNPMVDEAVKQRPDLFVEWEPPDFDELYSQMGTGGALTVEGAVRAAEAINRKRDLHDKLSLLLETEQAEVVAGILEVLYQRVKTTR